MKNKTNNPQIRKKKNNNNNNIFENETKKMKRK